MADLTHIDGWLNIKWEYIPDLNDKITECSFFLDLASNEHSVDKFRWLISAFLNAAYSYFESKSVEIYHTHVDAESGNCYVDKPAHDVLSKYVGIKQCKKDPSYIKTWGRHELTKELYRVRAKNTHHGSIAIVPNGDVIPENFECVIWREPPKPALKFCREVMALIRQVQEELEN
jgi:hypothetical protein